MIVAQFSPELADYYRDLTGSAPIEIDLDPLVFVSHDSVMPSFTRVHASVATYRYLYNVNTRVSEAVVFLQNFLTEGGDYVTQSVNLDVESLPHFVFCEDPMRSKLTRFWANSVLSTVSGLDLVLDLRLATPDEFNKFTARSIYDI